MILIGPINGETRLPGNSKLSHFVRRRLPEDYLITLVDLEWLDRCDGYLKGSPTNDSVTAATKAALKDHPRAHIDPFELLIDSGICDKRCEPVG